MVDVKDVSTAILRLCGRSRLDRAVCWNPDQTVLEQTRPWSHQPRSKEIANWSIVRTVEGWGICSTWKTDSSFRSRPSHVHHTFREVFASFPVFDIQNRNANEYHTPQHYLRVRGIHFRGDHLSSLGEL
jgi:hypothetical protein